MSAISIKSLWIGVAVFEWALALGAIHVFASSLSPTQSMAVPAIGNWTAVRVRGSVGGRGLDAGLFVVPDAVICKAYIHPLNKECLEVVGKSLSTGVFDFTFQPRGEIREPLTIFAPGCTPQGMIVRYDRSPDRRGDYLELVKKVTLDCREGKSPPDRERLGGGPPPPAVMPPVSAPLYMTT